MYPVSPLSDACVPPTCFPGDVHQVTSLAAHDVAVKSGALPQILLWTSVLEIVSVIAISQMLEGSGRQPGDFKVRGLSLLAGWLKEHAGSSMGSIHSPPLFLCR